MVAHDLALPLRRPSAGFMAEIWRNSLAGSVAPIPARDWQKSADYRVYDGQFGLICQQQSRIERWKPRPIPLRI